MDKIQLRFEDKDIEDDAFGFQDALWLAAACDTPESAERLNRLYPHEYVSLGLEILRRYYEYDNHSGTLVGVQRGRDLPVQADWVFAPCDRAYEREYASQAQFVFLRGALRRQIERTYCAAGSSARIVVYPAFPQHATIEISQYREQKQIPTVGFVGQEGPVGGIRSRMIRHASASRFENKFVIRDGFAGGSTDKTEARRAFTLNMANVDFALCPPGQGLFTYRFYEALASKRIPIIIDDDAVKPFEGAILWSEVALIFPSIDVFEQQYETALQTFWDRLGPDGYRQWQTRIYNLWVQFLSPVGFFISLANRIKAKQI